MISTVGCEATKPRMSSITTQQAPTVDWKAHFRPGVHLRAALVTYGALRIVLFLWAIVVLALFPVSEDFLGLVAHQVADAAPDNSLLSDWLLEPWMRWDANWYTDIAINGFQLPHATAYAPLYPALIRLVGGILAGRYLLAALLVSNVCAVLSFWLLHWLVTLDHSVETAHYVLLVLAVFPTSFFLLAPYTEPLFLCLSLGALLCGRKHRWACAAILAMLASLTRWQGVGLGPALAWMYLDSVRAGRSWRDWRAWALRPWQQWLRGLWLTVIPLGVGAVFQWYTNLNAGLPWDEYSVTWETGLAWPWVGLLRTPLGWFGVYDIPNNNNLYATMISDWVLVMLFLALCVAALRRVKAGVLIFGWLVLFSSISMVHKGLILRSVSRYVLMVLPAFIMLGLIMRQRPRLLRIYIGMGVVFSLLSSGLYVMWVWVA